MKTLEGGIEGGIEAPQGSLPVLRRNSEPENRQRGRLAEQTGEAEGGMLALASLAHAHAHVPVAAGPPYDRLALAVLFRRVQLGLGVEEFNPIHKRLRAVMSGIVRKRRRKHLRSGADGVKMGMHSE